MNYSKRSQAFRPMFKAIKTSFKEIGRRPSDPRQTVPHDHLYWPIIVKKRTKSKNTS